MIKPRELSTPCISTSVNPNPCHVVHGAYAYNIRV